MLDNAPIEVVITLPFPEDALNTLRDVSPRLKINTFTPRRVEDIPPEVWARCEVLYTDRILPTAAQAPKLRWIQFHYAGIDYAADAAILRKPGLIATTLSGAAAPQVAEYCFTMMLALGHHLPEMFSLQSKAQWPNDRWERLNPRELRGSTVGLIGYGSIGRELARLLQPFGVTILAAKKNVMHPTDNGYNIPGLGDPDGDLFQRLYPMEALVSMIKLSDYVVCSLPLSPETRGMIGAEELNAMKPTAYLIDVGRGGIIDPAALTTVLQDKRIAGAALDVFSEEPLLSNSPFWRLPNVIISPHIAGISPAYQQRAAQMFSENLARYINNETLYNIFDVQRGY